MILLHLGKCRDILKKILVYIFLYRLDIPGLSFKTTFNSVIDLFLRIEFLGAGGFFVGNI